MRSRLIIAFFLILGLLFPMLPKHGRRAAAPSASGRATCASRIPVRANARPEAEGAGLGFFLPHSHPATNEASSHDNRFISFQVDKTLH